MSITQTIPVIDAKAKAHRFVRSEWVIGLTVGLRGGNWAAQTCVSEGV